MLKLKSKAIYDARAYRGIVYCIDHIHIECIDEDGTAMVQNTQHVASISVV